MMTAPPSPTSHHNIQHQQHRPHHDTRRTLLTRHGISHHRPRSTHQSTNNPPGIRHLRNITINIITTNINNTNNITIRPDRTPHPCGISDNHHQPPNHMYKTPTLHHLSHKEVLAPEVPPSISHLRTVF